MDERVEETMEERGIGWNVDPVVSAPEIYPGFQEGVEIGVVGGEGFYPDIGFISSLISRAKTYTECPICLEILTAPIYQCPNGHIICHSCIERVEACGECRVPLEGSRIRNVALEFICQSMEVKCPNGNEGCTEVTTVEHLKNHLDQCRYRAIPFCSAFLGLNHCSENVSTSSVLNHLREAHQVEEVEQAKVSLCLIAPFQFERVTESGWNPVVVTNALDLDVLIKCEITKTGYLSISGYLLDKSENYKNYRMKLQLNSCSKIARLEWTGNLQSLQSHLDSLPNLNTFQIPINSLKEFCKPYSAEDDEESQSLYKLKVKIALWKIFDDDDQPPFQDCFNTPEGEKISLDNVVLISKSTGEFSRTMHTSYHSDPEQFFPNFTCRHCDSSLFNVIYRCLQCPSFAYFCKHCTEVNNVHGMHLMVRVPSPEKQPLAEVVFECCAGELT